MPAAPDDDARKSLTDLEAKLRALEHDLLRDGHAPRHEREPESEPQPDAFRTEPFAARPEPQPDVPPAEPLAARPEPQPVVPPAEPFAARPEPQPDTPPAEPLAAPSASAPDPSALDDVRELLRDLRATIEHLGAAAGHITVEARAMVDEHGGALARLDLAARAAARAEEAAVEAGRVAGSIVVDAGPFVDPHALIALRDALAARPNARGAYIRGVQDGRAIIEVHLSPPPTA